MIKISFKSQIRNTKYEIRVICFLLLATYYLILNTRFAYGQSVDLAIHPPILQLMIKPGKSITQVYKLINYGDPVVISSSLTAFTPRGETGNITLQDCQKLEIISCESIPWFSFQNANLEITKPFFLGSNRTQEVVLKISVPDYASEGDYYNSLYFTSQAPLGEGERRTRAEAGIASNILITVSKDGNPFKNTRISELSAKNIFSILSFRFSLPLFDSLDKIPVILKVFNTGNAYTSVSGKITLSGFPGLSADFPIPPHNILANSNRLLTASPSAGLIRNTTYENTLTLPSGFYLGRYTLTAKIENEDGTSRLTKTSFFALPIKGSLAFLGGLILLSAYFKLRKKRG